MQAPHRCMWHNNSSTMNAKPTLKIQHSIQRYRITSTGMQHWHVPLTERPHCTFSPLGPILMSPLRAKSRFRRGESRNKVIFFHRSLWLVACCAYLLLIVCMLDYRTRHVMARVLIYPTSWVCPAHSLFSPFLSNFFLSHYSEQGGKKNLTSLSAQTVSEKTYRSLPVGWRCFSPVQEYE